MNPIALCQINDIPCLPLSFDINENDPFSNQSFAKLINEQHKLDLPYIVGVFYKKQTPYFIDALNSREWTKKNTQSIAGKKMRTCFYFTIENQNITSNYLGHSKEMDYRKEFIDTFFKAVKNDTKAMYDIGDYFSHGFGVQENSEEAIKWWTRSAEKGNADARYHLGLCYLCGFDVSKNIEKAEQWLQVVLERAIAPRPLKINKEIKFSESIEEWENDKDHGKIDSQKLISVLSRVQNGTY